MLLATKYDLFNAALFLPAGGSRRVRRQFVDALDVKRGQRVLELGCGTGQVTELLAASRADVVAIDALPAMMEGARRRVPSATFIEGDILDIALGEHYDRVVLSFLLHNFESADRTEVLRRSGSALAEGGLIGILDWALPTGKRRADLWQRYLTRVEPSKGHDEVAASDGADGMRRTYIEGTAPNVLGVLEGRLDEEIQAAGLRVRERRHVANQRAQILIASR
jgi:ubiquinone/menaquinone biosynthesis C-methylase UbiE